MTYDELADALEDAWLAAGLHEHVIEEQTSSDRHERSFRAELFADHDEPLPDPPPPWVDVAFRWGAAHFLRGEGNETVRAPLELAWTYHVELSNDQSRSDVELARAFHSAVRAAFRRVDPDEPPPTDYVDIEVRRAYTPQGDGLVASWVEIVGLGTSDLTDLWDDEDPNALPDTVNAECLLVAIVLHALHDVFGPVRGGTRTGYRTVETA